MTLYTEPRVIIAPADFPELESPKQEAPTTVETLGAAFRQENLVGAALSEQGTLGAPLLDGEYESRFGQLPDPDFNPWEQVKDTQYEQYYPELATIRSDVEFQGKIKEIDQELRDRDTLDRAGIGGLSAQLFAGFVDVPTLIPGFQAVRGATLSASVGRNATRTAIAAMAEATAVEGVLHGMQATRTQGETAAAIGGSLVLGAVLGGGVGSVLGRTQSGREALRSSGAYLDGEEAPGGVGLDTELRAAEGRDLSAAAAIQPESADFENPSFLAQKAIDLTPGGVNFGLSFIKAQSPVAQKIGLEAVDTPYAVRGTDRLELQPAAQVAIDVSVDRARVKLASTFKDGYTAYAKGNDIGRIAGAVGQVPSGKLTQRQFSDEVAKALRREDTSSIPEVQAAAQKLREEVIEPLKDRAIAAGLLPEDVTVSTAASYFTRMWDADLITRDATNFKKRISDHFFNEFAGIRSAEVSRVDEIEQANFARERDAGIAFERRKKEFGEVLKGEGSELSQPQVDEIVAQLQNRPKRPQTLTEFLAERGVRNEGGELSHIGADDFHIGKPGQKKIIRDDGIDLDTAAELAHEAGFIAARNIDDLVQRLRDDISGDSVFARSDLQDAELYRAYLDLEDFASRFGISRTGKSFSAENLKAAKRGEDTTLKALDAINRLASRQQKFPKREFDLDDLELRGYADEAAETVFNTLTAPGSIPDSLSLPIKARGPLKERTLNVRDLDFEDYLVDDAEFVLNRYARVMNADIELKNRFGSVDMEDQIKAIRDDYNRLIDEAGTLPPKERNKRRDALKAERERVIGRVEAVRDLMRGTYQLGARSGMPYRVIQSAMTYSYIRALGGLVLSALPDVYRMAMVHGVGRTWSGAVRPLIANVKQYKMTSGQLSELTGISEIALNNRQMHISDITDPMTHRTPVENALNTMGAVASKFSGATHWNQFFKNMAMHVTTNRLRALSDSADDTAFRQRLKLNKTDAARIKSALNEHGQDVGGVFDPMVSKWPAETRELYAQVLRADADTVIVTPGVGDKVPGAEHHYWLKPALQFKSFAVAAHGRTMVAGLQESQARFIGSAATMAGMGMFVYYVKALQSGRDPSDNPGTWIAEGIDRSGVFPLVMEANNWLEGAGAPGVYAVLSMGEDEASRYAVRSTGGKVLGPTFGLINDSATVLSRILAQINPLASEDSKNITKGDVGAARRLIPFGRHPGVKEYLDLWLIPNIKEGL